VTEREQTPRRPLPVASGHAGGPAAAAARGPRPDLSTSTFRTVVGVGPGTRPAARLSPITSGAGRPAGPRLAPSQPPPPMHPPIARVMGSPGLSPAALQAAAVAARPGPPSPAERRGPLAGPASPGASPGSASAKTGFGMPSLRRNVCPHFFMTGSRGAMPIQAPHLLKALVRQETNVSRCQLRGGVHMEQGYVNDVCLSARFNQCVFYEDELTR
jgi:hypothetical protein